MVATSVNEKRDGKRAIHDEKGKKYTRVFLVVLDTVETDGAITARQAAGVPRRGDLHDTDTSARVIVVDPQQIDGSPLYWNVEVEYSTEYDSDSGGGVVAENPLDRPDEYSWGHFDRTVILDRDKNGAAITNSAGDVFDPPLEEDQSLPELTIIRNQLVYPPNTAFNYMNSVNNSSLTIKGATVAPRQVKMKQFSGQQNTENGVTYFRVTYRVQFNPATWDRFVLDIGFNQLVAGVRVPILVKGEPPTLPQLLSNGVALTAAAPVGVFLSFQASKELNWSILNL